MLRLLRGNFFSFVAVLLAASFWVYFAKPVSAVINPQINFQGKLTKPDGTNATDGSYSITFAIYTTSSGGSAIWSESQSAVTVTDGIFRVALGSVTALPGSVDFNTASLHLGVTVGADLEMTPRIQFTASPYAFNSDRLGGLNSAGFVQLAPSAAQSDATTNAGIRLNKTSTGNFIQLEKTGVSAFVVDNNGNVVLNQAANTSLSVGQRLVNAAGSSLTIAGGQGGAGAAANSGGDLVLNGGAGGGTNGAGGNIRFAAGAGSGTGAVGSIIFRNGTDSAAGFSVQDSTSTALLTVDTTNDYVRIGNATADGVGVLLVLDSKNTTGDPAGVNGAQYYNSVSNRLRCFQNGAWEDCVTFQKVQLTADGTAASAITFSDTGLSFPVVSGVRYSYDCRIFYTAALASTGSRWSLNGPAAPTAFAYTSHWPSSTTAESIRQGFAYDDAAAASANSASTTGNIAFIVGVITPSANGNLMVRAASEVGASAITPKAGSYCSYTIIQ